MLSIRWITWIAIAFCSALALAAPLQAQTILHVDGDNGDVPPPFGNADGSDWGLLAFKFLQDALAEATLASLMALASYQHIGKPSGNAVATHSPPIRSQRMA